MKVIKIKLLNNITLDDQTRLAKGTIHSVREHWAPFQLAIKYQVIEGPHMGSVIPGSQCLKISEVKTYTESEYTEMENSYQRCIAEEETKREMYEELSNNLTEQIKRKDEKIERLIFQLGEQSASLKYASVFFDKRNKEKEQNG